LAPWQLVPVLGFALQNGQCVQCGARISPYYVLIELAGAIIALWAVWLVPGAALWPSLLLGWLLLALAFMDFRSLCLSDVLTVPLMFAGLATGWYFDRGRFQDHLIGAAAGWVSFVLVGQAYRVLRKREGLGAGDAKLLGAIGAWTRWDGLPSVVLIGSAVALMFIIAQSLFGRALRLESKIPFGTFLCAGAWIVWLYGPVWG
jgi:leader peptidase (prepilin peptidase)/N-methyltransferase